MKIIRDGKEITLTPQELREAYEEMQHLYDEQDVRDELGAFDDEYMLEYYGGSREQLEPLVEEMAYRMRRYIDKYDMHWDAARSEVIIDIASENLRRKRPAEI